MSSSSSRWIALLGLLAVAGYQNRDKLGQLLGRATGGPALPAGATPTAGTPPAQGSGGGLLGGLRDIFGGGGAGLTGGLSELLQRFTGAGHGDVAKSWVETGPNREPTTEQLETALGADGLDSLMKTTGLSREELLARLKTVLPAAIDKLTPEGRLPSESEAAGWMART